MVSEEELAKLAIGELNMITRSMEDSDDLLDFLPPALESADHTILVFPANECPDWIAFKANGVRPIVQRRLLNIMAYKMEDGSEILKIRLRK